MHAAAAVGGGASAPLPSWLSYLSCSVSARYPGSAVMDWIGLGFIYGRPLFICIRGVYVDYFHNCEEEVAIGIGSIRMTILYFNQRLQIRTSST